MNEAKERQDEQLKRDEQWNEIVSRFPEYFCRSTPDTEEYYQTYQRTLPPFDLFDFSASTKAEWQSAMSRYSELFEHAEVA